MSKGYCCEVDPEETGNIRARLVAYSPLVPANKVRSR